MKLTIVTRAVALTWLAAIPVAAAQEADAPPPAAPDPEPDPEVKSGTEKAEQSVATQPQVPTLRGGTLGMPAPETSNGLQAVVATDITAGSSTERNFDFFAKLGGLSVRMLELDILAENYRQSVPRVELGAPGALPTLTLTDFTSVGFRVRYGIERPWTMVQVPTTDDTDMATKRAATELFKGKSGTTLSGGLRFFNRADDDSGLTSFSGIAGEAAVQFSHVREDGIDQTCVTSLQKTRITAAEAALKRAKTAFDEVSVRATRVDPAVEAGIRATVEVEIAQKALKEQAAALKTARDIQKSKMPDEEACRDGRGYRRSTFISLASTHLNGGLRTIDEMTIGFPAFTEVRVGAGAELQTTRLVNGAPTFPRVGVYATASWARWTNAYRTDPKQAEEVNNYQLEAALYASGQFIGGFNGLLSFGVLRPYGHDSQWMYVLNVAPAIGAKLGGG